MRARTTPSNLFLAFLLGGLGVLILHTTVGHLEAVGSVRGTPTFDDYLVLEEARALIEELAAELVISFETIESRSRELVGAAAFRNHTNDAWREALLRALEQIRDEQRR